MSHPGASAALLRTEGHQSNRDSRRAPGEPAGRAAPLVVPRPAIFFVRKRDRRVINREVYLLSRGDLAAWNRIRNRIASRLLAGEMLGAAVLKETCDD